jgi:hypothetical protein
MEGKQIIKVGFCVAYDWDLLKKSVPLIYSAADVICLSLDKSRISWSLTPFTFDEDSFYSWVQTIDVDKKIRVYEDDFAKEELSPIQNDNRQRLLMSKFLGSGGWHVQIDADEYFINFQQFRSYLMRHIPNPSGNEKPVNVCCNCIPLIKRTDIGYLYVANGAKRYETMPVATNVPEYQSARRNSHFNHISPFFVLHETWARSEQELLNKLKSWGHINDFNKESYFNLWKSLDEFNYRYVKNFHPIEAVVWERLELLPGHDIAEALQWISTQNHFKTKKWFLRLQNNRILQGLKQWMQHR